jgi:hypothetical protein
MKVDDKELIKPFSRTPHTHMELRDTMRELTGEDLQKIFVCQELIDFGVVHQKSVEVRSFNVRNELRGSIKVQLFFEGLEELGKSDSEP